MEMLLFIGFWIVLAVIFTLINTVFSGKDTLDMNDFNEDFMVYQKRLSDINNRNNGTTCSKAGE